jgi:hypothetical protein
MIRGWLIFSSLVLSVLFRLWMPDATGQVGFAFRKESISVASWVYFTMEHIIAIIIACCLLIKDNTPRHLFILFVLILCVDMIHYWLFYRDDGIGFNLIKCLVFGVALLWIQFKQLFKI